MLVGLAEDGLQQNFTPHYVRSMMTGLYLKTKDTIRISPNLKE